MQVNIKETFSKGEKSEALIRRAYESSGWTVDKKDHKLFPYDFDLSKGDKLVTVEVKTFGHATYTTLFAELEQISAKLGIVSIPEYISSKEKIDYIIWVNRLTNDAHVYDNETFANYVLENKERAFLNGYNTGRGILIEPKEVRAGYKKTLQLGAFANGTV